MAELQIPEGRYRLGRPLHRGRVRRLKRAQSFHPDEQTNLQGLEFWHAPLELDSAYDSNYHHRTIPTFTSHLPDPSVRRTISFQHLPTIDFEGLNLDDSDSDVSSSQSTESHAERVAAEGSDDKVRGLNFDEIVFDPNFLCEKCRGINIESMAAEGGYVHLTVEVIHAQAKTCRLCEVLVYMEGQQRIYWKKLDETNYAKYQLFLSLKHQVSRSSNSGHFVIGHNPQHSAAVVSVYVLDTRSREKPRIWGTIRCFTDSDDPAKAKGVPWLRSVGYNTASVHSFNTAKGWIKDCLKTENYAGFHSPENDKIRPNQSTVEVDHAWKKPKSAQENRVEKFATECPTRLLCIVDPDDIEHSHIRLIETGGDDYVYATLSYCWGQSGHEWLCTEHKLGSYLRNIDRKSLPATIRDCIVIAAKLGIRYIWIDALCIVQDSETDWATESAKMGGIYHGALLTIAAAASSHSDGGCFNKTSQPRFNNIGYEWPTRKYMYLLSDLICLENRLKNGSKSRLYFVKENSAPCYWFDAIHYDEVGDSPLASRAWVFQEQVLSRRTIYYARSQLFWECVHCRLSEDNWPQEQNDHIYPITTYQEPMSTSEIIGEWYVKAVVTYSERSLSNFEDKFVAISAAAKATYMNRHLDYCAGLWKDCIVPGLMWRRSSLGRKSRRFVCPSWSWASQESCVSYRHIEDCPQISEEHQPYQPRVIGVDVDTNPKSPFGNVKSGSINIDILLTSGWLMQQITGPHQSGQGILQFFFSSPDQANLCIAEAIMDDHDYQRGKLTVAFLGIVWWYWIAILLEPIPGRTQVYQRVGIVVVEHENSKREMDRMVNLWRNIKRQCITII